MKPKFIGWKDSRLIRLSKTKNRPRKSVPPAVAGGSTRDKNPPATAGGTDFRMQNSLAPGYAAAIRQTAQRDRPIATRSSGIATAASFTPKATTSRVRIRTPTNAPTIAAMPPRIQNAKLLFVAASRHADEKEPLKILEINPGGAVRLGVLGRRSQTYSPIAKNDKSARAVADDINEKGVSRRLMQPRYEHHAITAGGVSPRNPVANPMMATARITVAFIQLIYRQDRFSSRKPRKKIAREIRERTRKDFFCPRITLITRIGKRSSLHCVISVIRGQKNLSRPFAYFAGKNSYLIEAFNFVNASEPGQSKSLPKELSGRSLVFSISCRSVESLSM